MRKLTHLFACLLSILLCVSAIFPSALAVNSSTDSKYDYSDVDDINIYDVYPKETDEKNTGRTPKGWNIFRFLAGKKEKKYSSCRIPQFLEKPEQTAKISLFKTGEDCA